MEPRHHPVRCLAEAFHRARQRDLSDAPGDARCKGRPRRPNAGDCSVAMFTQAWRPEELGWSSASASRATIVAETIVIVGPCGDACVYVAGELLYHIESPNRRFFLDMSGQHMRRIGESAAYDGRDTADEEAFDYEVAGSLARVLGAVRRTQGIDVERIARRLRELAAEVEQAGRRAAAAQGEEA